MTMTQQEVIKAFMASLANHGYSSNSAGGMLDSAIRASSRYSSASDVAAAMAADQLAAERQALGEVLGSEYADKTLSEVSSSIRSADAKTYAGAKAVGNAFRGGGSPSATVTVEDVVKERKATIFLETYCGIKLEKYYWLRDNGTLTYWNDLTTGNTDTGAITGSDAGGSATEKTAASVVPETYANTYKATTSTAQTIITNKRNWVVQATAGDDTITANGADSISAGEGADSITVNASGATVTSGAGEDVITVNQTVNDITLSDLNSDDALTISGEFEIGSAHIEDTLLVVTDKTGTRKIRLGDFDNNAKNASIKVNGSASTTIAQWLAKSGIVYSSLSDKSYAAQVLGNNNSATEEISGEDEGRIALDDYTPPAVEEPAAPKLTLRSLRSTPATASLTVNGVNVDATSEHDVTDDSGSVIGTLSSEFPNASTFTRNGLTIHLLGTTTDTSGNPTVNNASTITPKTFDELTTDQKTIVASLFKWWAGEALKLNEESYGIGFNSPTAMVKDIGLYFYNGSNNILATVWNWYSTIDGSATKLMLNVNMSYYSGISATDMNGTSTADGAGYLDRTLAHEFTHAVMASNVNFFSSLPQFIKEGTAELTHGIDDERGNVIFQLGYDADSLADALNVDNTGTGQGDAYAGGFMFMRYLAKTAAKSNLPAFGEITATVNVTDDGIYYITGNTTTETAQVAASEANVPTGAIKLGTMSGGVYTVNDTGVHQNISGVNKVAGLTVNDTFTGTDEADTVTTAQGSNIITGGGDDSIDVHGQYATINAGAGADTVNVLDGSHHSIDAGDGDNLIVFEPSLNYGNTVTSGTGNDTVKGGQHYDAIISTGAGNDVVSLRSGSDNFVDLGAGNDSILFGGTGNTIKGGAGDDTVLNAGNGNNVYIFDAENFGNDALYQFKATDKIILGAGFDYSISGNNITVTKGSATVGTIDVQTASGVTFNAETNIVTSHIEIDGLTYNKAGGYYEISDAQDLVDLATYVNKGNTCADMTFKVTAAIDMSTAGNFTQIVSDAWGEYYFAGTFDGQDHVISNLTITKGGTDDKAALFGINRGTIQNVKLLNANISAYSAVAGIAVYNEGGTIENCFVDGTIHDTCGNNQFTAVVYDSYDMMPDPTNPEVLPVEAKVENCYYHVDATDENATKVYAVNAPTGFEISDINLTSGESVTIGDKTFYKQGAQVTATVTATDNHLVIDGQPNFTATIDNADTMLDVQYHVQLTAGGETYTNTYSNVSVLGSAGDDSIDNYGSNVTIDGAAGNDEINLVGGTSAYVDVSDGNDTITVDESVTEFTVANFGTGDVIDFASDVTNLETVDGKLVVTVGTQPVTIGGINAVSTAGNNLWALNGTTAKYGDGKTAGAAVSDGKIIFTDATVTDAQVELGGISNLDGLSVYNNIVNIHASAVGDNGASIVSNDGYAFCLHDDWNGKTFTGTDDADNIILNGNATKVSVNAGAGNDNITNNADGNNTIDGGDGNDTIFLAGKTGNTVNTAQGNDTIKIDTRNDVNDFTVEGFNVGDVIQFIGYEDNTDFDHENPDPNTPQKIQGALDIDSLTTVDGKLVATAGGKTVTINGLDLSQGEGWSLDGNTATYFTGTTSGAYINGDKISFRAGNRVEQVQLGGISNAPTLDGNKVKLTAYNFAGDTVSVTSNVGEYEFSLSGELDGKTFTGSAGVDKISNAGTSVAINGGAGDDVIINDGSNNTINAGAGNDSIENSSAKVTIDGGAGSNTISLTGNNGTGNVTDTVIKTAAGANTIKVGADMKTFSVDGFGRNDVIELNGQLTADKFKVVEGNLVAGGVTVGGMGTFDEGGTFTEAADGSIVYTLSETKSITVTQATQSSDGTDVTRLVYVKNGSSLGNHTFTLCGLVLANNANDADNTAAITADDKAIVHGDESFSDVGGYYITFEGNNADKFVFATKDGTVYLVKLDEENALPEDYTALDEAVTSKEGAEGQPVTVKLADAILPASGTVTVDKSDTTAGDEFVLALAEESTKAFAWNATWSGGENATEGQTAYIATLTSSGGWYGEGTSALSYSNKAEADSGKTFTISSTEFANSLSTDSIKDKVTFTHDTAIIGTGVLGKADATVGGDANLRVALDSTVSEIGTSTNQFVDEGWTGSNSEGFTYALAHGASSEGYKIESTTLKYYPDETNAKVLTLTGLPESTTATNGAIEGVTVDDANDIYTVKLGDSVLNAAAAYTKAYPSNNKITVTAGDNYTDKVAIAVDSTADLATTKDAASKNDAKLEAGTGDNAGKHVYTTDSYSAYFEAGKAEGVTDGENTVITVNPEQSGKTFTISGLTSDATKDGITFTEQTDDDGTVTGYTFTFDPTILDKKDVIVTPPDSITNIVGAISSTYDSGKTKIDANVKVEDGKVTFQAAGYEAGYLTAEEAAKASEAYTTGIHTPTVESGSTAVLTYVKQRHGETFELTGLKDDVASKITTVPEAQDNVITLIDGVVIGTDSNNKPALTLSKDALGEGDIVLTNKDTKSTFENSGTGTYTAYTLALDTTNSDENKKVSNVIEVTDIDWGNDADKYSEVYETARNSALKNDSTGVYHAMAFEKDKDTAQDAKSATYTYTSQYNDAFYTQLPEYNAGQNGENKELADALVTAKLMDEEGTTTFKHYGEGTYLGKNDFTISGLATTIQSSSIEDGSGESVNDSALIIIDNENKIVTINSVDALPDISSDSTARNGTTIALSDTDNDDTTTTNYTLSFGTALTSRTLTVEGTATHNSDYSMSDEIEYTVTETKDQDGKGTGTYTITKSGSTAGYVEGTGDNAGKYTYQAQSGCEQFTVSGLTAGLTATNITENMIAYDKTKQVWTFTPTDALVDTSASSPSVTLEYKGQVTRAADETDSKAPYVDESGSYALYTDNTSSTKVAIDGSSLSGNESEETWDKTADGKFTFTTARTANVWEGGTETATNTTLSLKSDSGQGGDVLITLTGLADGTTDTILNNDVTITPCDNNGVAYIKVNDKYYASTDVTQGDDGTYTANAGATEVTSFDGYIFDLPASVLDTQAMTGDNATPLVYTEGTDSTSKYSTVLLQLAGITPKASTVTEAEQEPAALEYDKTATTTGTYNYTSIYTPEQYLDGSTENGKHSYTHVAQEGKTTFTISGLKVVGEGETPPTVGDKVTGGTEPSGDVIVEYGENGKITVTVAKSALPESPAVGATIQVTDVETDGKAVGAANVTLALGGTQGDSNTYSKSDPIPFTVTPEENNGTTTYTITLGGHTAGYYEETEGSGVYKYREQEGGQQFTIGGLASGLKSTFTADNINDFITPATSKETVDGQETTITTWTFKPTKDLIEGVELSANSSIEFKYNGTVTALDAGNQLPSSLTIAQDDTTQVALNGDALAKEGTPEGWTSTTEGEGDEAKTTFSYKAAKLNGSWTPAEQSDVKTATLNYTGESGGETFFTLEGLKSNVTTDTLNSNVKPQAYITDSDTIVNLVEIAGKYYKESDVKDGKPKDDATEQTPAGYIFNLTADVIDKTAMTTDAPVTYTEGNVSTDIKLQFNGVDTTTKLTQTESLTFVETKVKDDDDQEVGTGTYTYTSKYTPEQCYDSDTDASDKVHKYVYQPEAGKTTFTIEGLNSGLTKDSIAEIAADAETATYSGAVNVDYKSKQIVLTASALPTEHTEDNATIKVTSVNYDDGNDETENDTLTLTFDDSLSKHSSNDGDYAMSDTFEYTVTEDQTTSGTYTVTFAGNTAGYDDNGDGTYTYKAQTGGQQFTITGLASDLTKDDITKGMFSFTEATEGDDATPAKWTFKPTAELLADTPTSITFTYNGVVTKLANGENGAGEYTGEGTLTGATVDSTDNTTQVAFDTSNIATGKFTAAGWQNGDTEGTFIYKTAKTAEAWSGGTAAATTSTLTFTASTGGDTLVTLSGLKSGVNFGDLNKNAPLTYTDSEGNALTLVDIGNNQLYKSDEVENGKPKDNAQQVTDAKVSLNLTDSVIDRTAMQSTPVYYMLGDENGDMKVTFNGTETVSKPPAGEAATLKALTGEGKYTYTSANTPEYYLSTSDKTGGISCTYTPKTKGTLTFTISGLPESLTSATTDDEGKITGFDSYFTVATTTDDDNIITGATVTLGTGAANTELFKTDKAKTGVFALSDIKIDDKETSGDYKLALPETTTPTPGFITADHNKEASGDATLSTTDEGKTYTYTSTKYSGYLSVADNGLSIDFNASRGGEALFTVEGLKYTAGTTDLLAGDKPTVEVDDDAKTIVLRDGALAKTGDITIKATSTEVEGKTVTGEAYDMQLFDQDAYDAGLAKAKAAAVAALEPEAGTDAVTDEQKTAAETAAAESYAEANGSSIVKTEAVPVKAFFDATKGEFTPGYTPAYFTDDGKTSGTQTITFHEATGYGDTIKITGLADNLTYDKITEGKDSDGNTTFTVANGSKTLFVVTYVKASDNGTPDVTTDDVKEHYTVAPTNAALKAGESSYNITVTEAKATDGNTRTLGNAEFDGTNLVGAKNVVAKAVGTKDGDGYTYTISLSGKTAGFIVENGKLTSTEAKGQETFQIGGLKSGLKAAFLDKDGNPTNAATYQEDGEIKNNTFVGLKDTNGKVVVSFGNYDDFINRSESDSAKTIGDYSTDAKKVRIAEAALADGAEAVTFTPDSGKTFSFDGFVTGERVLTGNNANGICESEPESAYVFSETKNYLKDDNGKDTTTPDGTSNYVFEDKHLPAYFDSGTESEGTTTYTYHKAETEFETFTLNNLKSGLKVSDVAVTDPNDAEAATPSNASTAAVSITLYKDAVKDNPETEADETAAAVDGKVVLNTDAMPASDDAKTISVSENKNSYALSLADGVNTNDYKLAENGNATFTATEGSKYTYTAPKYTAYYTADSDKNTIDYKPARGGDSFVITGLKENIAGEAADEDETDGDGNIIKHAGEFTFTNGELSITEDGTVTVYRKALPDKMSADSTVNFDSDDDNKDVTFTLSFEGIKTSKDSGAPATVTDGKDEDGARTGTVTYTSKITSHEYLAKASTTAEGYDETYTYNPQVGGYVITISNLSTTTASKLDTNIKVTDPTYKADGTVNVAGKVTLYAPILQESLNEGTKISISLGTTDGNADNVKKAGDYQLALDTGTSTKAVTAQDKYGTFKYTSGTYTFTASGNTAGYTVDEAGQDGANSISYKAASGETTFTITGLKTGLAYTGDSTKSVEDQLKTKGVTIGEAKDGNVTVTIDSSALANKEGDVIKLTDGKADDGVTYKLALAGGIPTDKTAAATAGAIKVTKVSDSTATVTTTHTEAYYEVDTNNSNSYIYHAATPSKTFTITGLDSSKTVEELNEALSFTETANETTGKTDVTITVKDTSIFGKSTSTLIKASELSGYNITFTKAQSVSGDTPIAEFATEGNGEWKVESGTATYKSGDKAAFYSVASADEFTQIKFVDTVAGALHFALDGLSANVATNTEAGLEYDKDTKTVTIKTDKGKLADADGGLTIAANNDAYKVVLDSAIKLTGTSSADTVTVNAAGAHFDAKDGNDVIDLTAAASVFGGAGNDTVNVTEAAFVDGGAGNDSIDIADGKAVTLNFSAGFDTVSYDSELVIAGLDKGRSYSFKNLQSGAVTDGVIKAGSGDLLLTDGSNKLLIVGGAGREVTFVDSEGKKSSETFNKAFGDMLTFSGKTGVTVNGSNVEDPKIPFYGSSLGANEFAVNDAADDIVTIDASPYDTGTDGLTIEGNAQNNVITGTKYNDSINPGAATTPSLSTDTVTGGAGNDTIVYNDGKLTIKDFNSNGTDEVDVIKFGSGNFSITKETISGNNIVFGIGTDTATRSITLTDALGKDSVQVKVVDADGAQVNNNIYFKDGSIVNEDETGVTLTSAYKFPTGGFLAPSTVTKIQADNTVAGILNASAAAAVEITSSAANNTLIGSAGNDTLTGAANKADLFVYTGQGADTVTNFEKGDKVSLAAVDGTSLKAGKLGDVSLISAAPDDTSTTDKDERAIKFTFGSGKTLELQGAESVNAININGKNYFVGENMFLDNVAPQATGVTLTAGREDNFDATEKNGSDNIYNTNLKTIDASAVTVTGFNITGNDAVNSIVAGTGAQLVIDAGKGNDTVDVSKSGGKNTVKAGGGVDVIIGGEESGNVYVFTASGTSDKLTIKNFTAGDAISVVAGDNVTLGETKASVDAKGNVVFTAYDNSATPKAVGTVTVEGVGTVTGGTKISLKSAADDSNYTYSTAGILGGNSITLGSAVSGAVTAGTAAVSNAINVDATNAPKVTHITASNEAGTLVGNAGNNSLIGSTAADVLIGAAGNDTLYGGVNDKVNNAVPADTLTGGAGNDVFYFNGGNVVITDYSASGNLGADKIFVDGKRSLANYEIDKATKNLTLNYVDTDGESGKLVIEKGTDTQLTFTDGKNTNVAFYSTAGIFDKAVPSLATAITLDAATNSFDAQANFTAYPKLVTIDSGAVTAAAGAFIAVTGNSLANCLNNSANSNAATLSGGDGNDTLLAGAGGDSLAGGVGNDLFVLGDGKDTVLVGDNGTLAAAGNDTIRNFTSDDKLALADNVDFLDATVKGSDLTLSFKGTDEENAKTYGKSVGTVVLAGAVTGQEIEVGIGLRLYKFGSDGRITVDKEVRITSAFTGKTFEGNDSVEKIDASTNTRGVSITGGKSTSTIVGSAGNDLLTMTVANGSVDGSAGSDTINASGTGSSVTGGKGNDVFIYSGGVLTVTDFGNGTDKISLAGTGDASLSMKDLESVTFTAVDEDNSKAATIEASFGTGNTLTLHIADTTKTTAFNFTDGDTVTGAGKGKAYKFVDGGIAVGNSLTLISGTDTVDMSLDSLKSYRSVTVNYADAAILGQTNKSNNIALNETGLAVGGDKSDTLIANAAVTLEGGKGNDTFVIRATDATIADYSSVSGNKDKISIDAALGSFASGDVDGDDITLTYTVKGGDDNTVTQNTLFVTGGAKGGGKLDLVEGKTGIVRKFTTLGSFNKNETAVTLSAGLNDDFNAATYNADNKARIVSINSAAVGGGEITAASLASFINNDGNTNALTLTGGRAKDLIVAGDGGDIIDGGKGNDTLVGGDGADAFVIGLGDEGKSSITAGNDVIVGFGTGDNLSLQSGIFLADASFKTNRTVNEFDSTTGKLVASKTKGTDFVLTFRYEDTGKVADVVTLQGVEWNEVNGIKSSVNGADVTIGDETYTFFADGKIAKGDAITLTSDYKNKSFVDTLGTDGAAKYDSIYAAASTRGLSITGGDESKNSITVTGGSGSDLLKLDAKATASDVQFTGGKGNDTFTYGGGTVTVTDYSKAGFLGSDKITLASGFAMGTDAESDNAPKTLTAVEVDNETVNLTFGEESDILSLTFADSTKPTVTIADNQSKKSGGAGTNGTAYTFRDGLFGVGKSATVLAENGTFGKAAGIDGKVYRSVTGGAVTLDGSQAKSALKLTLTDDGKASGGTGADSLVGTKGGTLTGGAGGDKFIIAGAGDYVITDYTKGDKISVGADVGKLTDVESVSDGYKLTFDTGSDTTTLTLENVTSGTPIALTTTELVKNKPKATTATVYLDDHALYNKASIVGGAYVGNNNATKVTLTARDADNDFGGRSASATVWTPQYKSMASITACTANGNTVYGNNKANTITLDDGGTVMGGLGADTYIIKGGDVVIEDFGIGATNIYSDGKISTLASKVTGKGYDYEDPTTYAPGSDTLKINGKIISVAIDGIDSLAAAKKDTNEGGAFSVTLTVDYDYWDTENRGQSTGTIVLNNVLRDQVLVEGEAVNKAASSTDLGKLKIYDIEKSSGTYTRLTWAKGLAPLLDAEYDATGNGRAALDEIMGETPAGYSGSDNTVNDPFDNNGTQAYTGGGTSGGSSSNKNNH